MHFKVLFTRLLFKWSLGWNWRSCSSKFVSVFNWEVFITVYNFTVYKVLSHVTCNSFDHFHTRALGGDGFVLSELILVAWTSLIDHVRKRKTWEKIIAWSRIHAFSHLMAVVAGFNLLNFFPFLLFLKLNLLVFRNLLFQIGLQLKKFFLCWLGYFEVVLLILVNGFSRYHR
jgi:hypothetical protein